MARKPISEDERRALLAQERERADAEREEMLAHMSSFFTYWSTLEMDLANLLSTILDIDTEDSHVARAIYYKLQGFDARSSIVNAALSQATIEFADLAPIKESCDVVFNKIRNLKNVRNTIAHGSIRTFSVNTKLYVRIAPPIQDPHRAMPKSRGEPAPGLSLHAVELATRQCLWAISRVVELIAIMRDFHAESDALPDTRLVLQESLREKPYPSQ